MPIQLIIDTCADLTNEDLDNQAIILPIPVFIDGVEYHPFVNLSNEEFYRLLKTCKTLPHTSQTPLALLLETFKKVLKDGKDIVAIFMGSAHSGTFNSACVARETIAEDMGKEYAEKIHIIDSQNVTFPYAALCLEAEKLITEGKMSAGEIEQRINFLVPRIHMRAFIDDLSFLKRGGRISGIGATLGAFLNFKVVIKTGCNYIAPTDKLRGLPRALQCIVDTALSEDIDYTLPTYIGHTNAPEKAEKLMELVEEKTKLRPKKIVSIGPTVGTHVGEGSTGLCWFVK
jgi:DegV family protein with EDD domain